MRLHLTKWPTKEANIANSEPAHVGTSQSTPTAATVEKLGEHQSLQQENPRKSQLHGFPLKLHCYLDMRFPPQLLTVNASLRASIGHHHLSFPLAHIECHSILMKDIEDRYKGFPDLILHLSILGCQQRHRQVVGPHHLNSLTLQGITCRSLVAICSSICLTMGLIKQ